MSGKVFREDNGLASKSCQKLYLDSITADMNFVFDDGAVKVSAHKSLLSAGSPVLHTMFYGSLPETGDIPIADASVEAFKEFLQLFYLAEVELTSDNIFQVANLYKKYQVDDGLKLCEAPMRESLTVNFMCTGYRMALLLDIESVVKFCERKVREKADEVLRSPDFLDCDQQMLDRVVQLVSSKCSALTIIYSCIAWAGAKCERANLEPTSANLKAQLPESINQVMNWII